jgi:hypothetical protein
VSFRPALAGALTSDGNGVIDVFERKGIVENEIMITPEDNSKAICFIPRLIMRHIYGCRSWKKSTLRSNRLQPSGLLAFISPNLICNYGTC